jgi:hypothetical protein
MRGRGPAGAVVTVALVLAATTAACSGSARIGPSPSPFGRIPRLPAVHSRLTEPAGLVEAVARAVHGPAKRIDVLASATSRKETVALVRFPRTDRKTKKEVESRRLLSFVRKPPPAARRPTPSPTPAATPSRHPKPVAATRWSLEAVGPDLWASPPRPGSRSYPIASVAAGGLIGVGGFIDPRVTRVQAVDPAGSVVSRARPDRGAVVLFSRPGATLAGFDARGLAFATPTLTGSPGTLGGGDAAVGIGATFAAEIVSSRWTAAADLVADGVDARFLLPPLHRFLGSAGARVLGRGKATRSGATFLVDAGRIRWQLTLVVQAGGGTSKVRQYALDRVRP